MDDRDYDGKAGKQLIDFLGGGKAAKDGTTIDYVKRDAKGHDGRAYANDPRVGMIGGSYGGQIQYAIAGIDPRLDTIVPYITWNDLTYSLAPNNTSFIRGVTSDTQGAMKFVWTLGFFATGVVQGFQTAPDDPSRIPLCPNFDERVCPASVNMLVTGMPNEAATAALRHASVASFAGDIKIPTFIVQGQRDTLFNLQESVATYRALRAQGTPVKLLWQRGGHSGSGAPGESDETFEKQTYQGTALLEWFDHYLRDNRKAPSLDFTFFRDWVRYDGDATPAIGRAAEYPIGHVDDLNLSADGSLQPPGGPVQAGTQQLLTTVAGVPTSYTELSVADPGSEPIDVPGTSTAFTTAPLPADLDVIGVPRLDARLSAPLQALTGEAVGAVAEPVAFVRLEDVSPDGAVLLKNKLISPVRVSNTTVPTQIELPGIVHRFAKGHRIRLVIAGGDLAYRGNLVPGPVTIATSAAQPSILHLPVAGENEYGPVVRAAAPRGGASRTCKSRRRITLHLRRRYAKRVRSATVYVAGKRVAKLPRGRRSVRIDLRNRTRGRVTVRIVMRLRDGRRVVDTRRFRTCARRWPCSDGSRRAQVRVQRVAIDDRAHPLGQLGAV